MSFALLRACLAIEAVVTEWAPGSPTTSSVGVPPTALIDGTDAADDVTAG